MPVDRKEARAMRTLTKHAIRLDTEKDQLQLLAVAGRSGAVQSIIQLPRQIGHFAHQLPPNCSYIEHRLQQQQRTSAKHSSVADIQQFAQVHKDVRPDHVGASDLESEREEPKQVCTESAESGSQ